MDFASKLKQIRKQLNLSQEQLAEKLSVSRQAVTKWETGNGLPDIDNMLSISALLNISLDELLNNEKTEITSDEYLYKSVTEYDIDAKKHCDIKLGGTNETIIVGTDTEKIVVKLMSNTIATLSHDIKVKIDDIKNRIDLTVNKSQSVADSAAKKSLNILVGIPQKFISDADIKVDAKKLVIENFSFNNLEIDGRIKNVDLNNIDGHLELNSKLDMNIFSNMLSGRIDINQISATSKINIPKHSSYYAKIKGVSNKIFYTIDDNPADSKANKTSENLIELNGIGSELIVNEYSKENIHG